MRKPLLADIVCGLLATLWLVGASQVCASKVYPCDYADTVNITDGLRLKDGSYSFAGLVIPANLTAEYKVKVIDGVEYATPRHMRGCVCRLKPCITFCCPEEMRFDEQQQNCTHYDQTAAQPTKSAHVEVNFPNGSTKVVNVRDTFVVRYEMGCKRKYVDRKNADFWKWDLFSNGTLSRGGKLWSTDEYCFTPLEHKHVWSLSPLICERFPHGFRMWIYAICMILAIIINTFIFLMLVSIKEVRSTGYGESVIFYLASIIVGFAALVYLSLRNPMHLSHTACRNIGFLAYFFMMLSFLFLAIISWDLWYNFQSKRLGGWRRKLVYALAIAIAFGLKYLVKFGQDSGMAANWKPGIGDVFCWFDMRLWGILLFYYLPILLCLVFGLVFCAKAFSSMWHLPEDTLSLAGYDVKIVKAELYAFFAYLLAVVCVWARETIVYVTARFREHYFAVDLWSGICVLALAITACIFLLYKNKLVQSWWRLNVSNRPVNLEDIYTIHVHSPKRTGKSKSNGNQHTDEDKYEEVALN